MTLRRYTEEIVRSGLPGIRHLEGRALRLQLNGYLERVIDRDLPDDAGIVVRNVQALRAWMAAYAAASSSTATMETLREAATPGVSQKPNRKATASYKEALGRLWLLDEVPAFLPTNNLMGQLGAAPKHQLADPALAARLLDAQTTSLLDGEGRVIRDGTLIGALWESLVTQSVRVYAERHEARVSHLRLHRGRHEVDLIVQAPDGRVLAVEVKLAREVSSRDAVHLNWLADQLGEGELLDRVIITTGPDAYRRSDGVAVVPLALLGP